VVRCNKKELFGSKHARCVWCTVHTRIKYLTCTVTLLDCCGNIFFFLEVLDILFRYMALWILSNR